MTDKQANERSQQVMSTRAAAARRRSELDASFRQQLLVELGSTNVSVSQAALIDTATSAYVEIDALSSAFLRCSVGEEQMTRLSAACSQLIRVLRALGLPRPKDAEASPDDDLQAAIAEVVRNRDAKAPENDAS
jgi:hypothetical protein